MFGFGRLGGRIFLSQSSISNFASYRSRKCLQSGCENASFGVRRSWKGNRGIEVVDEINNDGEAAKIVNVSLFKVFPEIWVSLMKFIQCIEPVKRAGTREIVLAKA